MEKRLKDFFPINLRKIRELWKSTAKAKQHQFAGYTRTMIQTYETDRTDAPFDLVFWLSENTGIGCHDLLTREIGQDEIPKRPLVDEMINQPEDAMRDRKLMRKER